MKSLITITWLAAIAAAMPSPLAEAAASPQAKIGACKKIALLFARGTTEAGSMGTIVGMSLSKP
jgi:cutinase